MKFFSLIIAWNLLTISGFSSDHIDGPVTMKNKVADLVDLYAFKSLENSDNLVLILNVYPLVGRSGHFSEKVDYRILMREASIENFKFKLGKEVRVTCKFKTPANHNNHNGSCFFSNGLQATAKNSELGRQSKNDDFKLFVGKRSDPFFFNGSWAQTIGKEGFIPAPKDDNIMSKMNALSIVIEIESSKIFPKSETSMLAISAESLTKDGSSGEYRILDRLGRPEITNVSLNAQKGERDLRDLFNNEQSFAMKKENKILYAERLKHNIGYFDRLDSNVNWDKESRKKLVDILVDDFLVIDLSKDCHKDSFLQIEKALVEGRDYDSCGGRLLEDDIMDILYNTYIHANKSENLVSDGVSKPYKTPLKVFPYVAPPVKGFSAWSKLQLAKAVLFFRSLF
jgi:hypothetical protein